MRLQKPCPLEKRNKKISGTDERGAIDAVFGAAKRDRDFLKVAAYGERIALRVTMKHPAIKAAIGPALAILVGTHGPAGWYRSNSPREAGRREATSPSDGLFDSDAGPLRSSLKAPHQHRVPLVRVREDIEPLFDISKIFAAFVRVPVKRWCPQTASRAQHIVARRIDGP